MKRNFFSLIVCFLLLGLLILKKTLVSLNIWFYLFFISFLLSVFLIRPIIFLSKKFKILDYPAERKIHKEPIPILGGLAIYISFAFAIIYNFHFSVELKGIAIASTLIFIVGLIDDIKELPASLKLFIQVIACLILIKYNVILKIPYHYYPWGKILTSVLTILWVIIVTNSINFIDGIDGLAAGLSAIASFFFLIVALQTKQIYFAYLNVILLGAILGFLIYNFNPAKIFLGDNGSTFLGFCLASLAVMGEWAENNPTVAIGTPFLILSIPIFDLFYISGVRIVKKQVKNFKEWIEYVGKDHFHHRLMNLNFSQREVCYFLYSLAFTLSLSSLILREVRKEEVFLIILQVFFILCLISVLMLGARRKI